MKYVGLSLFMLISTYFLWIFHSFFIKGADKKRLSLKMTSGRRFSVYVGMFLVVVSFYALVFGLISEEAFAWVVKFAMVSVGGGVVAIGGEKVLNGKKKEGSQ